MLLDWTGSEKEEPKVTERVWSLPQSEEDGLPWVAIIPGMLSSDASWGPGCRCARGSCERHIWAQGQGQGVDSPEAGPMRTEP